MPKLRKTRDPATGQFLKGNSAQLRHGGYSSVSKDIPLTVRRQIDGKRVKKRGRQHLPKQCLSSDKELSSISSHVINDSAGVLKKVPLGYT